MTHRYKKSKQTKTAKLTGNGGRPDKPNESHWTQLIAPKGAALLAQILGPIHFVVKNHSQDNVLLVAEHGDLMDLSPGAVRATFARGVIRIENPSDKPALIEFDFIPIFIKP
jgi:hypothetical protein